MANSLAATLVRTTTGNGALQMTGAVLTFLVGLVLARGLGVEQFGVYGIAMAVLTIASIPGEFGLPQLVVKEVARSAEADRPRALAVIAWARRTAALVSLLLMLLIAVGALVLLGWRDPVAIALWIGLPLVLLAAQTRVHGAAVQGVKAVPLGLAPAILVRPLAFLLLIGLLFAAIPGAGAGEAMAAQVGAYLAAALFAMAAMARRIPARGTQRAEPDPNWLPAAMTMGFATSIFILQAQVGMIGVGALSSVTEAGLFRVAVASLAIVAIPMTVVLSSVAPHLSELHGAGDRERLQRLATRAAQAQFAIVLVLAIPLFVAAGPLLGLVFGPDYAPGGPALAVMAAGQVFSAVMGVNSTLLTMTGGERLLARAMLAGLAAGIVLMLVLVPPFGALGGAIANTGAIIAWNVLAWHLARTRTGIDTFALRRAVTP